MNLRTVTLHGHDLRALHAFYADVLGFEVTPGPSDVTVHAGASDLRFVPFEREEAPVYHFAMNIPENRFAEAVSWVSARTPLLEGPDGPEISFRSWNAHSLYFRDPAGNVVEYIARHNLDNGIPGPFTPDAVVNVSEIGLPVPNVADAAEALDRALEIPRWSGNEDTFAAVGDEHGLVILVAETHTWYPIGLPVGVYPVRVRIDGDVPGRLALAGTPYVIESGPA